MATNDSGALKVSAAIVKLVGSEKMHSKGIHMHGVVLADLTECSIYQEGAI
jgi:hypothetical protein